MVRSLVTCTVLVLALAAAALAQTQATGQNSAQAPKVARPAWKDLTPAQREALAPLAEQWDTYDRDRKLKWLEVAKKYPQLTPEGRQRLHERMEAFAKLTPEQRRTARTNFQRAYELPMEQRQSLIQRYQELPPEKKQELAEKARKGRDAQPAAKAAAKKPPPAAVEKPIN